MAIRIKGLTKKKPKIELDMLEKMLLEETGLSPLIFITKHNIERRKKFPYFYRVVLIAPYIPKPKNRGCLIWRRESDYEPEKEKNRRRKFLTKEFLLEYLANKGSLMWRKIGRDGEYTVCNDWVRDDIYVLSSRGRFFDIARGEVEADLKMRVKAWELASEMASSREIDFSVFTWIFPGGESIKFSSPTPIKIIDESEEVCSSSKEKFGRICFNYPDLDKYLEKMPGLEKYLETVDGG